MNKKKIFKKIIISSLLFLVIVILIFYFIFKEHSFQNVLTTIEKSDKRYLLVAIFCMSCFSISEALNLQTILKLFGNKISFKNSYKYAISGYFASSITPSSSGGDPLQLYLMTKDKIPVSHSTIALLTKLLSFQFIVILISIVGFIFKYQVISNTLLNFKYLIYLGIFLNLLIFLLYFFLIFYKNIIFSLINFVIKILNKIHYKKTNNLKEKINLYINEFSRVSILLKNNKVVFLRIIITTFIQMCLYFSIPYFVYFSFSKTASCIIDFIFIQAILFVSVSALPLPGAVGVSEVSFLKLYQTILEKNILMPAMIITRFINFYLFVFYSALILFIYYIKDCLKKRTY